ncbi:MAG: Rpn family recombination-promoting nuclease/putative transposase [Myxacorys chilensis ATA2-1-KO14]|jgi:predicted transposase/invertase (TIGR01784 family)|nr:Rpn family recombination-promoting nuclease/putative transposase [Myxacorys chilensis ATA2-1-KO14]
MVFINPKTDFAFKKIFGSEQSRAILISFLNGILYQGQPTVQDLTILNPYQAPKIRGVKDTYLDVKALLSSGETVIIEMQVLNVEGFEKRILYNAAKAYSIQLSAGEAYSALNPVIALTITDFEMFEDIETPISHFVLKEKDCLVSYPMNDLELVFVELPKFKRSLEELETLTDKWIYFLQHAPDLRTVPETMGEVVEIQQAFEMANQATLTPEELDELEHQIFFIQDQRGAIVKATKQALRQGVQQGERQAKIEVARRMIGAMNDATIAQMTDLTIEEIQQLRQSE